MLPQDFHDSSSTVTCSLILLRDKNVIYADQKFTSLLFALRQFNSNDNPSLGRHYNGNPPNETQRLVTPQQITVQLFPVIIKATLSM